MSRRFSVVLIVACLLTVAMSATPASAESAATRDCYTHNKLTQHYTVSELRSALATMPAEIKEYTSCYQVEEDQLFRQLGKPVPGAQSSSKAGSGDSFISTPLLVVIIVVVLAGGALAYIASRRGRDDGSPPTPPTSAS